MLKTRTTVLMLIIVVSLAGMEGCSRNRTVNTSQQSGGLTDYRPAQNLQVKETAKVVEEVPIKSDTLVLYTIYFDFDKYEIRSDQMKAINNNAELVYKNGTKIKIEGHCDERGTDEYNIALGQRRADTIKDYLISYGVKSDNIATVSYGELRPVAQEHNESAWSLNRRCEFVVVSETAKLEY